MTVVKLSSKGQLVLPKEIRDRISASAGTLLEIEVHDGLVLLRPLALSAASRLHGKFRDARLLDEIESEHGEELAGE